MSRKQLAQAIDRRAQDHAREEGQRREYATVHATDPLQVELHESGLVLDDDDLVLSQWARRYDYDVGIEVGDTAVLDHLPNDDYLLADLVVPDEAFPPRLSKEATDAPLSDMNAATESGWYYTNGSATHEPPTPGAWQLEVIAANENVVVQFAHSAGADEGWRRVSSGGVWSAWVQVFPPPRSGTAILNGSGAPSPTTGELGDYYLDEAADTLYGPKRSTVPYWQMAMQGGGVIGPQGPQGIQGAKGDKGDIGLTGPQGAASTVPGPTGPQGLQGLQGIQGIQGNTGATGQAEGWLSGTADPTGGVGAVGDWYLNTTSGAVFEKTGASVWTARANITGPQGLTGSVDVVYNGQYPAGTPYTDGDLVVGADGIVYMCVRPTSAAPTPWTGVNGLSGPPGPQGPQGPTGATGAAGANTLPTVQNGKWLKGSGGAAVWAGITATDVPGLVVADTNWHYVGQAGEPAFQNGWGNLDTFPSRAVRYRKLASGLVLLAGIPSRGTSGTVIFTLPAGWRHGATPAAGDLAFLCYSAGGVATVGIDSASGTVACANLTTGSAVTSWIYLNASWLAES